MTRRLANISIGSAGGTATAGSKTYKITLPSSWMTKLGITENQRRMELSFDGESIVLSPFLTMDEFIAKKKALGHEVLLLRYFDRNTLCTTICADFTDRTLRTSNHTDNLAKTAFGNTELPGWDDFLTFLEERCVPRSRMGIREYLEAIGVDEYDPLAIVRKTGGRMAEDEQWLEIEVLK